MSILDDGHIAVLGGDFTLRDSIYTNVALSDDGGRFVAIGCECPHWRCSVYGSTYCAWSGQSNPYWCCTHGISVLN